MTEKCVICDLVNDKKVKVFYEDGLVRIIKDKNKSIFKDRFLVIWKNHERELWGFDLKRMLKITEAFRRGLDALDQQWDIGISMKSQPQHFHMHIGRLE